MKRLYASFSELHSVKDSFWSTVKSPNLPVRLMAFSSAAALLSGIPQGWIQSSSSDLQKSLKFFPNLFSQLFIAVHEINYPSCFIVYYEIKQRRNYSVDHTANPALLPSELDESPFARFCPLSILPRTTPKKFEGTTGQSFYLESGDWMYMDLFTNHSKPTSIGQNHSHCLPNYSNSVMIGYSRRKLPCKLLTIIYKEEPLPHNSLRSC